MRYHVPRSTSDWILYLQPQELIEGSKKILKEVYGYASFLPGQEEIISTLLHGQSAMALLPTGGGKSLCYQLPGLQLPGICLVISPLIALIEDQVNQLQKRNVKAFGITGMMSYRDLDNALDNAIYGNYKFLYLSPERLQNSLVQERIQKMNINLIAVDEAHCISEWGHDFRPAYRHLSKLKELQPNVPFIAVTATATKKVQQDILNNLEIADAKIFKNSFKRENTIYRIHETSDKRKATTFFYKEKSGSSIAYVRSRLNCLEFSQLLNDNGIRSGYYHGGMDATSRVQSMKKWMNDSNRVMVATNAFGMGIDKPDVRSVVHLQLPDSIESYFQETGRAGRDGESSLAQFIYNLNDLNHARNQFIKSLPTVPTVKLVYRKLCNYLQIPMHEGQDQTHQFSFASFCHQYDFDGNTCYQVLQILDRFDVLKMVQGISNTSRLRFRESAKTIIRHTSNNVLASKVLQAILRTYGSSQHQDITLQIGLIAEKSNATENEVVQILQQMEKLEVVELHLQESDTAVTFLEPREDDRTINRFATLIKQQTELKEKKLNAMMQLVQERDLCIQNFILRYFDEPIGKPCGKCSNCNPKIEKSKSVYNKRDLLNLLSEPKDFAQLQKATHLDKEKLLQHLKNLLENKEIQITDSNQYKINE